MKARAPRVDQPLFPADRDAELEAAHAKIYAGLLNGVYRAGVGELLGNAAAAAAARADVARALDELEATLARSRYVLGPALTAVDVRLAMTLLRFDAAYLDAFALRGAARGGVLVGETADGGGPAYPALRGYTREMYARVGGALRQETAHFSTNSLDMFNCLLMLMSRLLWKLSCGVR